MRVNPPLPTRLGLIARSTGVLLGLLAIALALLQPSALPWLPLTGGLGLVGTGLLVLGWPSGRQARRQPMLAFMDTIAQLPGKAKAAGPGQKAVGLGVAKTDRLPFTLGRQCPGLGCTPEGEAQGDAAAKG